MIHFTWPGFWFCSDRWKSKGIRPWYKFGSQKTELNHPKKTRLTRPAIACWLQYYGKDISVCLTQVCWNTPQNFNLLWQFWVSTLKGFYWKGGRTHCVFYVCPSLLKGCFKHVLQRLDMILINLLPYVARKLSTACGLEDLFSMANPGSVFSRFRKTLLWNVKCVVFWTVIGEHIWFSVLVKQLTKEKHHWNILKHDSITEEQLLPFSYHIWFSELIYETSLKWLNIFIVCWENWTWPHVYQH